MEDEKNVSKPKPADFRNSDEARREMNGLTCFQRKNVTVNGKEYERLAVQTHFVSRGESYLDVIKQYVAPLYQSGDILSISEKVITMCQNHTVDKKDVKLGFWAKLLSRFASSNNHGVAMDQPYKLQLAINLCGLPRILFASIASAVTKLFGMRGVFYKIAGHGVAGIDGFYPNSSFELYHDLALLSPVEPSKVCNEIHEAFGIDCMIVDANDLNVEILGKADSLSDRPETDLKALIQDNPAGQHDELTPLILMIPVASEEKAEAAAACS